VAGDSLRITGIVVSAEVDPQRRDVLRRWLVTLAVDDVLAGELPPGTTEVGFLVHSPSRDFVDADLIDKRYTITLLEPFAQPYAGEFEVAPTPSEQPGPS
jgi:hypothetical protein